MSKAVKLKNNLYLDTRGIVHKGKILADILYPIGSVYMSTNSTSPATLFGGTWKQIKDRFLLACGDSYKSGQTGGEKTHTLTIEEMPSHIHDSVSSTITWTDKDNLGNSTWVATEDGKFVTANNFNTNSDGIKAGWMGNTQQFMEYCGGNRPHNNMPPYLVVYMWYRTA